MVLLIVLIFVVFLLACIIGGFQTDNSWMIWAFIAILAGAAMLYAVYLMS